MFYSSPENASEGDTMDSPSKAIDRIHHSLSIRTIPQHPTWHPHPQSWELLENMDDMWPIVDNKIREELNTHWRVLQQNLPKLNMGDLGIMLAMYGSSRTTVQPSFIVLCPERLPPGSTMIEGIPNQFQLIFLWYTHKERSQDVLLKG